MSIFRYSGRVCGKPCMRPEGCHIHGTKKQFICSERGKPTGSTSGRCPLYISGVLCGHGLRLRSGTLFLQINLCKPNKQ